MITKVEIFHGGGPTGKKLLISFFLRFKPFLCKSVPMKRTKVREKAYLGVLQHPTMFQAKTSTEKCIFLKKIKKSSKWLSQFFGIFFAKTAKHLRLVG